MADTTGELRPEGPVTRPETARPSGRDAVSRRAPTDAELDAMERHLCLMAVHAGARGIVYPDLGGVLVALGAPAGRGVDQAALVRWPDDAAEQRLDALEARMRSERAWPALLLVEGRSTPPGLGGILSRRGWSLMHDETVLWTRSPVTVPHLDPRLRLEAVTSRTLAEHEALERRIFGVPGSAADGRVTGTARAMQDGTLRAYLLRSGNEAVAAARLSLLEGLAALSGIGVVPERRGEGLGTFITAVALRAGLAMGRPLVWLSVEDGNEAAARLYVRLGFRQGLRWHRWLAPAQKE